jgi:hypothetical protein
MTKTEPRPASAAEAVQRARRFINRGGQYVLGTGDFHPHAIAGHWVDVPWTERDGQLGSDCAGFAISFAYKLRRHRPGYAKGMVPMDFRDQADIDDDINVNSCIEDALTTMDLFKIVGIEDSESENTVKPGDLLCYPSLRLTLNDGTRFRNIGHVGIVIETIRVGAAWNWMHPPYHLLDVAQCKGPGPHDGQPGRSPAVIQTDGSLWEHHDVVWPKPAHRTVVLRAIP